MVAELHRDAHRLEHRDRLAPEVRPGALGGVVEVPAPVDRLRLDERRLTALASAVRDVVGLVDPVGESVRGRLLPNGLRIDQVRVPRTNLLNRYGDVAEDGTYSSPIESPGRRFFTMLGTLVQGRVSLSLAATTASFLGLHGAIAYGEQRRQFNASDPEREEVLLDYQNHQRRLVDRLARAYADAFASNELLERFDGVFSGRADSDLTGWGEGWNKLCDSILEHKKAKKDDVDLMKEVGAILKQCADLERRIGIR